jgi:hypothetical protein
MVIIIPAGHQTTGGDVMAEGLPIRRKLVKDIICRITDPDERVREVAIEALAVSTWDEDWRPDELILNGGIDPVLDLLRDDNPHIIESALDVIIATAASGEQESLISAGAIARLDALRDSGAPEVREKARDALWLLEPEVEDVVASKPHDEY